MLTRKVDKHVVEQKRHYVGRNYSSGIAQLPYCCSRTLFLVYMVLFNILSISIKGEQDNPLNDTRFGLLYLDQIYPASCCSIDVLCTNDRHLHESRNCSHHWALHSDIWLFWGSSCDKSVLKELEIWQELCMPVILLQVNNSKWSADSTGATFFMICAVDVM